MKDSPVGLYIVIALSIALAGTLAFGLWLIGAATLKTIALILSVAGSLALLIGASALPIRAWRRRDDAPVVEHYYHDGTRTVERHTLDGRSVEAPRLLQLPAPAQSAGFPELLQAAYRAGAAKAGEPQRQDLPLTLWPAQELRDVDPSGWSGEIRP